MWVRVTIGRWGSLYRESHLKLYKVIWRKDRYFCYKKETENYQKLLENGKNLTFMFLILIFSFEIYLSINPFYVDLKENLKKNHSV